jgi:phage replication-related protein YjqB (UPF0714/DUF867 family)
MTNYDKYSRFEELKSKEIEGQDYSIVVRYVENSDIGVIAPHGGKIEFLTAELADSIASHDYNFYAFRGHKPFKNSELHLTSTNFDEPQALRLVGTCNCIVAVHGLAGTNQSVQIGGRDQALLQAIHANLSDAGFQSRVTTTGSYGGTSPSNICNRGNSGMGVQIEIEAELRKVMRDSTETFDRFVNAVRNAIAG